MPVGFPFDNAKTTLFPSLMVDRGSGGYTKCHVLYHGQHQASTTSVYIRTAVSWTLPAALLRVTRRPAVAEKKGIILLTSGTSAAGRYVGRRRLLGPPAKAQPRGDRVPKYIWTALLGVALLHWVQAVCCAVLLQQLQQLERRQEPSPSPTLLPPCLSGASSLRSSPRVLSRCTLTSRGRPCASLSHHGAHREGTLRWRVWGFLRFDGGPSWFSPFPLCLAQTAAGSGSCWP